jgi:hypothetical protein
MESLFDRLPLDFREIAHRWRSWSTRVGSVRLQQLVHKVLRWARLTVEVLGGFISHDIGPRPLVWAGIVAAIVGVLVIRRKHGPG